MSADAAAATLIGNLQLEADFQPTVPVMIIHIQVQHLHENACKIISSIVCLHLYHLGTARYTVL